MDFVPLVKPGDTVKIVLLPFFIMADGVVGWGQLMGKGAVCFQVIFIYDVDTHFVRQLQEKRIGRIVRGADGINVEVLAELQIPLYFVRRQSVAVYRAGIVMVDAMKLDLLSVDQEKISADLHGFEADTLFDAGRFRFIVNAIKDRFLRIPFLYAEIFKRDRSIPVLRGNHFAF